MKLLKIDGKPIVDATKAAVLQITAADVAKGRKKAPDCCAAAQACVRQMKATRALVHLSRIYVEKGPKWVRYVTPANLRTEIVSFDRGHRFEAGDYKLVPLQLSQQRGATRKSPRVLNGTKPQRGNRMKQTVTSGVRFSANPSYYAAAA